MSTMQSQQVMWQGRARELPTSSKQQPGASGHRRPMGIQAGLVAVVLAALGFFLVLCYGAASALTTRNGYAEMSLRREIEDLRAEIALLNYQINLAHSESNLQLAAQRFNMRPADPRAEVDYLLLPHPAGEGETRVAAGDPPSRRTGIAARLAELAETVVGTAGGRAEASTVEGHRR